MHLRVMKTERAVLQTSIKLKIKTAVHQFQFGLSSPATICQEFTLSFKRNHGFGMNYFLKKHYLHSMKNRY